MYTKFRPEPELLRKQRSSLCFYLLRREERVLLEKLTGFQLVKKFQAFYGTRKFITAFTNALHLFLSWAISIQSIPPHSTSWRSILILYSHLLLGLPSGLFPSGFPTKILYTPLFSPIRATIPAHLIILDFIIRTILGERYRSFTVLNAKVAVAGNSLSLIIILRFSRYEVLKTVSVKI